MKISERERLVLTLLPLAIILGGYAWWFNMFERHRVAKVEADYERASAGAVRPVEVVGQRAQAAAQRRQIDSLKTERKELEDRRLRIVGELAGPQKRMRATDELTGLFERHGLQILEECPAGKDHAAQLPPSMTAAFGRLEGASKPLASQVRCIHFTGRYMDVLAALEEIAQHETPPAIPVGLTMSETEADRDVRTWTLQVWM
jgi:hypothetical protein